MRKLNENAKKALRQAKMAIDREDYEGAYHLLEIARIEMGKRRGREFEYALKSDWYMACLWLADKIDYWIEKEFKP